jgi:hypothetical protein
MRINFLIVFGLATNKEIMASIAHESQIDKEFLDSQRDLFLARLPALEEPSKILAYFGFNTKSYVLDKLAPLSGSTFIPVFKRVDFVGADSAHHQDGVTVRKWSNCRELSANIVDKESGKRFLIEVMFSESASESARVWQENNECIQPTDPGAYTTVQLYPTISKTIERIENEGGRLDAWIRYLAQIAKYKDQHSYLADDDSFWRYYATSLPYYNEEEYYFFFYHHQPQMIAVTVMQPPQGNLMPGGP